MAEEVRSNWAAVLKGPYGEKYSFERRVPLKPKDGEALVALSYTGLCHGDVYSRNGGGPAPQDAIRPLTGGHEGVGRIVELGSVIACPTGQADFAVGDVVGIAWRRAVCGECPACSSGAENFCPQQRVNGMHLDGTFQQYATFPTNQLHHVPAGIAPPSVCPILCAGVTSYGALKRMQPVAGRWCVIFGATGGVGHLAVQYAKAAFNLKVLGVDGGSESKRDFATRLGCDDYVDFVKAGPDLAQEVTSRTSGGAHYALVLSPSQEAWRYGPPSRAGVRPDFRHLDFPSAAIQRMLTVCSAVGYCLRFGGKIMAVGIGASSMPLRPVLMRNLTINASQTGTKQDMIEALHFASKGAVTSETEVVPFSDLDGALDKMSRGGVVGKLVVDLQSLDLPER